MRWVIGGGLATLGLLVGLVLVAGAVLGAAAPPTPAAIGTGQPASTHALADIPPNYLAWYTHWAAECAGLPWSVVAAIGKLESDHGRSRLPGVTSGANHDGAAGPMQFGIGGNAGDTWAAYGIDGDGDGSADVYNPADAIRAAVGYLCAHGARNGANLHDAIFAYNHSGRYVDDVLTQARRYSVAPIQAVGATAVQALLDSPRLRLTETARGDLQRTITQPGWIDERVIGLLNLLIQEHTVSVSVLRTGHSTYVRGTERVSNHTVGRAVDLSELDGQPVNANNQTARSLVAGLLDGQAPLRPDEIGSPFAEFDSLPVAFTDADHRAHLHIGYNA